MKTISNKTLGFTLAVLVAATVEEYDDLAGKKGACLDDANQFILFHDWNSTFRKEFCDALEKLSGITRPVDEAATAKQAPKKDGTRTEVKINEKKYVELVLAQTGNKITDYQELATEVAARVKFDPSEGSRGGGKLSAAILDAARGIIGKGQAAVAKAIENLQRLNPGLVVDLGDTEESQVEGLARGIKVNQDRKAKEALAELNELTAGAEEEQAA